MMTMEPVNRRFPFTARELVLSFLGLWILWAVLRWPAFVHPFWIADDFSMWDFTTARLTLGGAAQGRFLNGIWYSLYFLFPPPDHLGGSLVLRSLGGALHSGASLLLLVQLGRCLPRPGAWGAVLLFHLWAFNSEATIWFAGSTYPLALLMSLGGAALITGERSGEHWPRCLLGSLLIAAAIHCNQAPATAGFCLWLILSVLRLLSGEVFFDRRRLREACWLGLGYVVGGVLSFWAMKYFGGSRLAGAPVPAEKLGQLVEIWKRLWWFPGIYPRALQVALALFLGFTLATWAWASFRRWIGPGQSVAVIALFVTLSIVPFGANLLAPENSFPVRVLYAGTLVWVGMAAWLAWFARCLPLTGWITGGLLASILLWNSLLSVREAAEFGEIYRRDLEVLTELERFAAEQGTNEILFMDWQHSSPWEPNPYELGLYYSQTIKAPVFQQIHWSYRFVDYYSDTLENTPWWPADEAGSRWDRLRRKYSDLARSLPHDEWVKFVYLEAENLVLVIPR